VNPSSSLFADPGSLLRVSLLSLNDSNTTPQQPQQSPPHPLASESENSAAPVPLATPLPLSVTGSEIPPPCTPTAAAPVTSFSADSATEAQHGITEREHDRDSEHEREQRMPQHESKKKKKHSAAEDDQDSLIAQKIAAQKALQQRIREEEQAQQQAAARNAQLQHQQQQQENQCTTATTKTATTATTPSSQRGGHEYAAAPVSPKRKRGHASATSRQARTPPASNSCECSPVLFPSSSLSVPLPLPLSLSSSRSFPPGRAALLHFHSTLDLESLRALLEARLQKRGARVTVVPPRGNSAATTLAAHSGAGNNNSAAQVDEGEECLLHVACTFQGSPILALLSIRALRGESAGSGGGAAAGAGGGAYGDTATAAGTAPRKGRVVLAEKIRACDSLAFEQWFDSLAVGLREE
jgi:hypothetical protein